MTLPNYSFLLTQLQEGVLIIILNRPDKLNALNQTLLMELDDVFEFIVPSKEVKSVVITGSGDKAFAAGADIAEFKDLSPEQAQQLSQKGQLTMLKIAQCEKPVIAAIVGYALGGGFELALSTHLRIAGDNAQVGLPESTLGLLPGYGGTQRLTALVGKGRALQLMLTAQRIKADEALAWGIFNSVVSPDKVLETAIQWCRQITLQAPISIRECIRAVMHAELTGGNAFLEEAKSFGLCAGTQDFKEGTAAFMEKRKPSFKGE